MAYKEENIDIVFDLILERIENGEALRNILKDENMPSSRTFYKWLKEDEVKVKLYEESTTLRSEALFDKMFEIANNTELGEVTKLTVNGLEVTTSDMIAHRRLKIDVIKWGLSKVNPKKYGDKIQTEHSGEIKSSNLSNMSTDELIKRAGLIKKING